MGSTAVSRLSSDDFVIVPSPHLDCQLSIDVSVRKVPCHESQDERASGRLETRSDHLQRVHGSLRICLPVAAAHRNLEGDQDATGFEADSGRLGYCRS